MQLPQLPTFMKTNFRPNITSFGFQLNYKWSASLYVVATVLMTSYLLVGRPIQCLSPGSGVSEDYMSAQCWSVGTSLIRSKMKGYQGVEVGHPGVGPGSLTDSGDVIGLSQYRWTHLAYLLYACVAYLPYFLWKALEGGKASKIYRTLTVEALLPTESRVQRSELFVAYFLDGRKRAVFRRRAMYSLLIDFLNVASTIAQAALINTFTGGNFLALGPKLLGGDNPLVESFPFVSKCHIEVFGPSGTLQILDSICLLNMNGINLYFHIGLWFWVACNIAIASLLLAYTLLTCASYNLRVRVVAHFLNGIRTREIKKVVRSLTYSDWQFLVMVAKNSEEYLFHRIFTALSECLLESKNV